MTTSAESSTTTLSRDELYDLVWTKPIMRLAEIYDISDVGLAKMCRRLRVPRPPVGYWQRVAAGQKISRIPLRAVPRGLDMRPATVPLQLRVEKPGRFTGVDARWMDVLYFHTCHGTREYPRKRARVQRHPDAATRAIGLHAAQKPRMHSPRRLRRGPSRRLCATSRCGRRPRLTCAR